ncbi:hypothetical protein [Neobacillus dielmonensis]|uniref:hypothetical protein n=1 Tax=Neobacillus dielmonensis TaxID=1347369 RepID=UPI000694DBD4|nr:hypothetical protein [Neobacillus dielmonensis]
MKFFIATILSAVLLFSLAACQSSSEGTTKQNQTQSETPSKKSDNTTTKTEQSSEDSTQSQSKQTTQASNTNTNGNQQSEEFYYGQWQIKKVIAYGPAGTYSTDDINALIEKQVTFSKESATCFGEKIEDMNNVATNPVYKKRVIAKAAFPSEYRVTFEQLGITGDTVTELDATDANGICTVTFITPDKNKLILFGGGTFFEMNKHSTPSSENQAAIEENNRNKAISLVKDYLRAKDDLVEDQNHFVQFEETYNRYYIVRYSTLVSGHTSTNGRYAVDLAKGKVIDLTDADFSVLNK